MMAIWGLVKAWFGGLSTTTILVAAGIAAAGILTFSIFHAGAASARAAAAEQLANENAKAVIAERTARDKAETAVAAATLRNTQTQSENEILKEMVDAASKGSASRGCATAVLGLHHDGGKAAAPNVSNPKKRPPLP